MSAAIQSLLPWCVIVSHFVFIYVLLAFFYRKTWGREVIVYISKYALVFGLIISGVAIVGSLFYSSVAGFAPCDLCWWQRVLLFPQIVLFVVALKVQDRKVFGYILPLSVISAVVSLYNTYVQFSGSLLIPCSAVTTCTKVYVLAFNYVTIPTMALTIGAYLILLSFIARTDE